MRLVVDLLAAKKEEAENSINRAFGISFTPEDAAYIHKRALAASVFAGGAATKEFEEAASVEGMTSESFAALILSKPDVSMARETARRTRIVAVRSAASLEEIDRVMSELDKEIGRPA